jgi:PAS domain S-box-containing protein
MRRTSDGLNLTMSRNSWSLRLGVAAGSMACALVLTHAFWRRFEHTPFLLGFGAAILSSRVGGRHAGFFAVIIGVLGYASFPPPLPEDGVGRLLFGFAVISGAFSWLVARRYEIEADLRTSQERLRAVISSLPVVLWVMNRKGYVTLAEGSGLDVLELKPRELVGRSVFELYRAVPEIIANARRVLAGETFTAIVTLGEVVVETWYSPLRDDQGSVTGAIGVSLDVTERRAAEQVVIRSERRLQTIIDAEPACVKVVSSDGILLDMNRAGLEIIGAEDVSQVVGRPITDLVHPDDWSRYLEMHGAASSGSPGRWEFRIIRLSGGERWVDSHAVPFETSIEGSGTQRAVLSVTSDITERKQLEQQLRGAQQMEAVGRLAGGVAHDFNNLLTAISGFTELVLLTLDETDSRRADLFEVRKAAVRAETLTRQLLAFSRRQILQTKVFDVNALVSDIEKLLFRTIGEDIELVLTFDPALEPVRADPSQLEQVVLNLAVNARDAMPKGGQLRFVTEMVDVDEATAQRRVPMPPGRYVRLTITDTGTGMSDDIQRHIFEPFFTTKERNKGTGLGLATVYGIVKQSGGYVWVTSRLGLGTSFEIFLPPVQEAVEPLVRVEPSASPTGGTETVLLAEDDGAVRRLASTALRQYGYTVLEARDGADALQVARNDQRRDIHLLITDVVMPGLSGRDLALHLAAERSDMRVLYTSGYAESVTMRTGLERGVPLLAKPFLPHDLVQRVREILDSSAHQSVGDRPLDDWMS